MTVLELIAKLCQCNPDALVLVYETGGEGVRHGYEDAHVLREIKVGQRETGKQFYPHFLAKTNVERNTVEAVCLE